MAIIKLVHFNYFDKADGKVFCWKNHMVQDVIWDECLKCPYFHGDLQGDGIECEWDDPEYSVDANIQFVHVVDAYDELARVQAMVDEGHLGI